MAMDVVTRYVTNNCGKKVFSAAVLRKHRLMRLYNFFFLRYVEVFFPLAVFSIGIFNLRTAKVNGNAPFGKFIVLLFEKKNSPTKA